MSDYLWHGQTQTWGKPALQAGIEADHVSGLYAGFWGSNVSSHWLPNANLETDWSVGFRNTFLTDFRYDIGGTYVYYPDGNFSKAPVFAYASSKLNTVELYGSLGWKWFTVKGGYNPTKFYGWNANNSGILGVGAMIKRPVVVSDGPVDAIAIKPMCYLSLTFDHRVVDGAVGDAFLTAAKRFVESYS